MSLVSWRAGEPKIHGHSPALPWIVHGAGHRRHPGPLAMSGNQERAWEGDVAYGFRLLAASASVNSACEQWTSYQQTELHRFAGTQA
jgi:hypothetical protein